MTRYDFFWPAAELCAWGNARLVGDRTPLPPRLQDGVLHERFVDVPGQRVAESVEEWYRHLMDRAVVRLRLLPHRWPVSGEILAERPTGHDSLWAYGGHEDGYRTTLWRARLIGEDESVDPSGSPALAEAMENFAAKLDSTEAARRALGLPSYQRFRAMLAGEVDAWPKQPSRCTRRPTAKPLWIRRRILLRSELSGRTWNQYGAKRCGLL